MLRPSRQKKICCVVQFTKVNRRDRNQGLQMPMWWMENLTSSQRKRVMPTPQAGRSLTCINGQDLANAQSRPHFPQFHSQIFRFHDNNCVDLDEATV